MPRFHSYLSFNNRRSWIGLLLVTGINVIVGIVFGVDLGQANPRLDSELGDLAVPHQSSATSPFYTKRIRGDLSLSDSLHKFQSEQLLELPRSETETIKTPPIYPPDHPKAQFTRAVNFQRSSDEAWSTVQLYFDLDRNKLGDDLVVPIETSVELHAATGGAPIYVEAYCDQRGGLGYSLALGARRIQLVKQYLLDLGVSQRIIEAVNYGSSRPPCGESRHRCERTKRRIQSTFDFFAIQESKLGCVVRIKMNTKLTSSDKKGFSAKSLLPYHTRLAPLRRTRQEISPSLNPSF